MGSRSEFWSSMKVQAGLKAKVPQAYRWVALKETRTRMKLKHCVSLLFLLKAQSLFFLSLAGQDIVFFSLGTPGSWISKARMASRAPT